MESFKLAVEKRTLFGKKAKRLKRTGFIPANIFGKKLTSQSIQVKLDAFIKTYKRAKKTHLVYLTLDKTETPVLIQNVQKDPVSNLFMHVDFRKMDLTQKIETHVPVVVTGELDVVKSGEADVILLANSLLVSCLPTEIPEKIEANISGLSGIGAEIKIKDLPTASSFVFSEEPEKTVVQISAAKKEEIVAPVVAEALPVEGAPTTEPGAEGAQPTTVGEKKEEKKSKS